MTLINQLLKLPFDINQRSAENQTLADIAWENENCQILLRLLQMNSCYPSDFDPYKASDEIKEFLNISLDMHAAEKRNKKGEMTRIIGENPNLRHYYNLNNESVAALALTKGKEKVYNFLLENKCSIGPHEDIKRIVNHFVEPESKKIKLSTHVTEIHKQTLQTIPERYMLVLAANSVIPNDDPFFDRRTKYIKNAYDSLNEIPVTQQILRLIGVHTSLKIHFDFNRMSTEYMKLDTDNTTRGLCDTGDLKCVDIFVAAQQLSEDVNKFSVIGTLAHELCHFAMLLIFLNDCKPYGVADTINEPKFNKAFKQCQEICDKWRQHLDECKEFSESKRLPSEEHLKRCEELRDFEEIVQAAFDYTEDLKPSELIVRVPHLIAHYHNDQVKLAKVRKVFKELFDYYDEVIVPKINETLPILKKFFNNPSLIKFKDLTSDYKAKIQLSLVKLQGFDVKFEQIVGNFDEIPPKFISAVILEDEDQLTIGLKQVVDLKFYIDRYFIDYETDTREENMDFSDDTKQHLIWPEEIFQHAKNFEKISQIADDTKMILLSDDAGSGKSLTFMYLISKLKERHPDFWISYIDLKRHLKIYEEFEDNFTKDQVFAVLLKILAITDEFEVKTLRNLNCENKVIFLFDGVDEIAPTFKSFFVEITEALRSSTKNQIWIATRPPHLDDLMEKFKQKAFKFLPFDDKDKKDLIYKVLTNIPESDTQKFEHFKDAIFENYRGITSPLLLRMITVHCFRNGEMVLKKENEYQLYFKILEAKLEAIEDKGSLVSKDRDNIKSNLTIWQVHQIYALKLLYGSGFEDPTTGRQIDINQLSLVRKWKPKEKSNWTAEQISRYGFLIVDHWNTDKEIPDFFHRTLAEFFVAQFLIQNIYELDDDDDISDSQIELLMKLLFSLSLYLLAVVLKFISSYIANSKKRSLNERFFELILTTEMRQFIKQSIDCDHKIVMKVFELLRIDEQFLRNYRDHEEPNSDDDEKEDAEAEQPKEMTIFQLFFKRHTDFDHLLNAVQLYEENFGDTWIEQTGYDIKESFPSDGEIFNSLSRNFTRFRIDESENDFHHEVRMSKKIYKLMCLVEIAVIPRDEFIRFLDDNKKHLLEYAFRSFGSTEKLLKIFQKNYDDDDYREELHKIVTEGFSLNFDLISRMSDLVSDSFAAHLAYFYLKFDAFARSKGVKKKSKHCFNLEVLKNLFEKYHYCTQEEIQNFLIDNSVRIISEYSAHSNDNMEDSLRGIFLNNNTESGKSQFRRFLETHDHDFSKGHTVLTYLNEKIENQIENKFVNKFSARHSQIKAVLLQLEREANQSMVPI